MKKGNMGAVQAQSPGAGAAKTLQDADTELGWRLSPNERAEPQHQIRIAKQPMTGGRLRLPGGELDQAEVLAPTKRTRERILAVYDDTFGCATELIADRWARLKVVLVGDGSRFGPLESQLPAHRASYAVNTVWAARVEDVLLGSAPVAPGKAGDVGLVAVASGLSFPASDIPPYWRLPEVYDLSQRPPPVRGREGVARLMPSERRVRAT